MKKNVGCGFGVRWGVVRLYEDLDVVVDGLVVDGVGVECGVVGCVCVVVVLEYEVDVVVDVDGVGDVFFYLLIVVL